MSKGEITQFLSGLARGEPAAQERICQAYLQRLIGLARTKRLQQADAQAVAVRALRSCFSAMKAGRLSHLGDSEALWGMLAWITAKSAIDVQRRLTRERRRMADEPGPTGAEDAESDWGILDRVSSRESEPFLEMVMRD